MAIDPPGLPPYHPDRESNCEEAVEAEFRKFVLAIEEAGWTGREADTALMSLALKAVTARQMRDEAEADVIAASRRRAH